MSMNTSLAALRVFILSYRATVWKSALDKETLSSAKAEVDDALINGQKARRCMYFFTVGRD